MSDEEIEPYYCPIHGEVEGVYDTSGPLSNNFPVVIQCEHEHDSCVIIVLDFKDDGRGKP